jgi:hypothetical protein
MAMPSNQPSLSTVVVPAAILADFLGVPERRIEELTRDRVLVQQPNGAYHLKSATDAFYKHKYGRKTSYEEEHARLERIKRQEAELNLTARKAAMGILEKPAATERQVNQRGKGVRKGNNRAAKVKPEPAAAEIR